MHERQASGHWATAARPELEQRNATARRAERAVHAATRPAPRASTIARPPRTQTSPEREPTASRTFEIANEVTRAYKDALGRGPTKSNVQFAGADTLVVVLHDTMTFEERKLVSLGTYEPVRECRVVLTSALEDRLRSIVERALGRRTLAFISGFDILRDVAVDIFTLAPETTDGQPAAR